MDSSLLMRDTEELKNSDGNEAGFKGKLKSFLKIIGLMTLYELASELFFRAMETIADIILFRFFKD